MPNIIPVPVVVSVGISATPQDQRTIRNFGSFKLLPYATTRGGSLDIARWLLMVPGGETRELDEAVLFGVLPRKLLWHVCQHTFESERESIPMVITIDDQSWVYPMCAKELEYEQVHYMVEIEGEWFKVTDVTVNDIVSEEQFAFCEREVLPSIDFGDPSAVYENMN